jgi:5'-nucleotidase
MVRPTLADKLVVAISSRALFDLTDSHRVYTEAGVDAYHRYQIEREDEILAPGPAFVLVKKLLRLNRPDKQYVEVILLSRNSADTGLRVFNAIKHYGLDISRAAFTKGEPTSRYVPAFGAHLFLSADTDDVRRVLTDGYAAATIVPSTVGKNETNDLRIAFDGDAVLFSDEAERVYQKSGLAAFSQSETDAALQPLSGGPFKEFLASLHRIQSDFAADQSPIRTALVTARSAPAHERVIRTLRAGTSGSTRRCFWPDSTRRVPARVQRRHLFR